CCYPLPLWLPVGPPLPGPQWLLPHLSTGPPRRAGDACGFAPFLPSPGLAHPASLLRRSGHIHSLPHAGAADPIFPRPTRRQCASHHHSAGPVAHLHGAQPVIELDMERERLILVISAGMAALSDFPTLGLGTATVGTGADPRAGAR